jgi:hypothetical protein
VKGLWSARAGGSGARELAADGGHELVGSGKGERERSGDRDLGFRVKFDGVHVAHVFNLRTWVPTFLRG